MSQSSKKGEVKVFDASKYKVGIVVSEFNNDITDKLLEEALKECAKYKIPSTNITIKKVAGAVEIPLILQRRTALLHHTETKRRVQRHHLIGRLRRDRRRG